MPNLSIPTVTIEDLQAFQAQHFGDTRHAPSYRDTSDYPDDDLGYYPDGVKRTLTDEQIRIFRHSEIHTLLREREVEAENEAFEQSHSREELDEYAQHGGAANLNAHENSAMKAVEKDDDKIERIAAQPPLDSESTLDYGEDGSARPDQQSKTPISASFEFAGRKIISYED